MEMGNNEWKNMFIINVARRCVVICFAVWFSVFFLFLFLTAPDASYLLFWRVDSNVSYVRLDALYSQQLAVVLSAIVSIAASC